MAAACTGRDNRTLTREMEEPIRTKITLSDSSGRSMMGIDASGSFSIPALGSVLRVWDGAADVGAPPALYNNVLAETTQCETGANERLPGFARLPGNAESSMRKLSQNNFITPELMHLQNVGSRFKLGRARTEKNDAGAVTSWLLNARCTMPHLFG